MNVNREVDRNLAGQASSWVTVMRRGASREERAAFAEWLRVSPRHVREFLTMTAIERELPNLDSERRFGLHELRAASPEGDSNVVALGRGKARPARVAQRVWLRAAAAALIAAVVLLASPLGGIGRHSYVTQTGEQRAIELEDGSIVHLNTRSRVKVKMSAAERDIELFSGEALFKVHRDPARPFRVHVGETVIEALGTEFNVYRKASDTMVAVLEGAVRVGDVRLDAGEEARVNASGSVRKHVAPGVSRAVAWRQRRLVFDNDSLSDMVAEFNRYNTAPKFRLEGVDVENYHFTGMFDADDPESLVELLAAEPGLTVDRVDDVITVRPR